MSRLAGAASAPPPRASTAARLLARAVLRDRYACGRIVESWFIPDRMSL